MRHNGTIKREGDVEIRIDPQIDAQLTDLAALSGRAKGAIIEEALLGYLDAVNAVREEIDRRYDEVVRGEVTPIPVEEAFKKLREHAALRSPRT